LRFSCGYGQEFYIVLFKLKPEMPGKVKVLFLLLLMSFLHVQVSAQTHFIFIQSENKQPFSVIVNNKTYGSSGSGYVIIPQLKAGSHLAEIKLASNQQTVGIYKITINYNDLGFTLKEEQQAWVLENVQSKSIVRVWVPEEIEEKKKVTTQGNGFGDILSQVVSDPNLTKKREPIKAVATNTEETKTVTQVEEKTSEADADSNEINTSGVIKNSEEQKKEGLTMVFVDFNQKTSDTVTIVIPEEGSIETDRTGRSVTGSKVVSDNEVASDTTSKASSTANEVAKTVANDVKKEDAKKEETKTEEVKNIDVAKDSVSVNANSLTVQDSVSNPFHKAKVAVDSTTVEKLNSADPTQKTDPTINPNCKGIATNDDFVKLRRRMAAQDNDEAMIDAAKKAFKSKCYTTDQIKHLGSLFLNDQSRYAFFDASYNYVFDPGNFASLESQLIEDYYKKRFKAMLH
jgi:hypothetical protein